MKTKIIVPILIFMSITTAFSFFIQDNNVQHEINNIDASVIENEVLNKLSIDILDTHINIYGDVTKENLSKIISMLDIPEFALAIIPNEFFMSAKIKIEDNKIILFELILDDFTINKDIVISHL